MVCGAVNGTSGCSRETCSLPLVGTCPEETICSPDCPDDHIPCYAPSSPLSNRSLCPEYTKSCLPAVNSDGCPNFCPVFCDPGELMGGGVVPVGEVCPGPPYCIGGAVAK